MIDYESPYRDRAGKRTTGWAGYKLLDKSLLDKGLGELYNKPGESNPGFDVEAHFKNNTQ